jgi:hypothetical protein
MLNPGAEIDLMVTDNEDFWRWSIHNDADANSVTLASGIEDYPAIVAAGGDIEFSTNRTYRIDDIENVLATTVATMLGILPADETIDNSSRYYDDNFDDSSTETALATLTNSFADLIDPFDPDDSPGLFLYDVQGDPGVSTPGVNLLSEETPEAPAPGLRLTNDEFAARQFLYPFVRVPGDFNGDKMVTAEDLDLLSAEVRLDERRGWFDLNADQIVNQLDVSFWVHDLKTTWFGDSNLDGEFNSSDLVSVFQAGEYEDEIIGNSTWATGDWNGDTEFTTSDLVVAFQDGGYEQGPRAATASVPEPSSYLLIISGFILLAGRRTH